MNIGTLAHDIQLDAGQRKIIRPLSLLINKPTLYVANVDEDEIDAEERGKAAIRLCWKPTFQIPMMMKKVFF